MNALPDSSPIDIDKISPDSARTAQAAQRLDMLPHRTREPDPQLTSTIRLKVTDVMVYERNPRRASHERIVELKESIRVNGIEQIIAVTRRPGEARYVVAKGGNSRLTAAKALHDETGDDHFLHYDFLYVPYPGEAKLLAAHLRENDQRADLCFWDKANGYLALKADLERERGAHLSLREFSRLLEADGTAVSHVLLSLFQFAVDRLAALGPATVWLSRRGVVDALQPAIGSLTRLSRRLGFDDVWLQQNVIDPELRQAAARIDTQSLPEHDRSRILDGGQLATALRHRFASSLGVSRAGLERMCHLADHDPDVATDALRQAGGLAAASNEAASKGVSPEVEKGVDDQTEIEPDPSERVKSVESGSVPDESSPLIVNAGKDEAVIAPDGAAPAPDAVSVPVDPVTTADPVSGEGHAAARFHEAVVHFARACGLDGCVHEAPALPYGFMMEPPEPDRSGPPPDHRAQPDEIVLNRYLGWWWLVGLSRQNTASGLELVPRLSRYGRMAHDEEYWTQVCDAAIGEPLLADRMDVMFDVVLNPQRAIGEWWTQLLQFARAFRAAHPERFTPPRWLELDADERLWRGEGA